MPVALHEQRPRAGADACARATATLAQEAWSELAESTAEASDFLGLLDGLGLFPNGLPPGETLFMPTNAAMERMLRQSGFNGPDALLASLPAPGPDREEPEEDVGAKLIAFVMYHVIPDGAHTDVELAAMKSFKSALEPAPPLVVDLQTKEDGSGAGIFVRGPAGTWARIIQSRRLGGSVAHILDNALMPEIGGLLRCPLANLSHAARMIGKVPLPAARTAAAATSAGSTSASAEDEAEAEAERPQKEPLLWEERIRVNAARVRAGAGTRPLLRH
eukprot:scaffold14.g1058.t1